MTRTTMKPPVQTMLTMAPLTTPAELEAGITQLGDVQRKCEQTSHRMNAELDAIKTKYSAELQRLEVQESVLRRALTDAAGVLRAQLLQGDSKTATLGAHLVAFRLQPPKVEIRSVEKVIEAIKRMKFAKRFLRTKEEISREALLADPARAETIPGVTIRVNREEVVITPFGAAQ